MFPINVVILQGGFLFFSLLLLPPFHLDEFYCFNGFSCYIPGFLFSSFVHIFATFLSFINILTNLHREQSFLFCFVFVFWVFYLGCGYFASVKFRLFSWFGFFWPAVCHSVSYSSAGRWDFLQTSTFLRQWKHCFAHSLLASFSLQFKTVIHNIHVFKLTIKPVALTHPSPDGIIWLAPERPTKRTSVSPYNKSLLKFDHNTAYIGHHRDY